MCLVCVGFDLVGCGFVCSAACPGVCVGLVWFGLVWVCVLVGCFRCCACLFVWFGVSPCVCVVLLLCVH